MLTISKEFTFEASHILPLHPGKCSRLHGHSWKLGVTIKGQIDKQTGFIVDYGILSQIVNEYVIDKLDHQHLGQGGVSLGGGEKRIQLPPFAEDFYPSSENLVVRIAEILDDAIIVAPWAIPNPQGLHPPFVFPELYEVRLAETCTCTATWRRPSTSSPESR